MKADAIGLLMWIDTVIYGFVDYVYDIFNALAKVELFKTSDYQSIVRNIYAVLGIIMLFVLAYSLLKAVINPDEFAKGETSFPKLIKNVVISLAIIAVLPTVFTVAFNFQNSILNKGTIPKLIFGTGTNYDNENAGSEMAYYVFSAFLHPNFTWCEEKTYPVNDHESGDVNLSTCADNINADGDVGVTNGPTLKTVSEGVLAGDKKSESGNYSIFDFKYGESVADGKVTYNIFISTIAGVFLLYVLVNFCFDMAVRVVKLMFFQIIAPIPVICRVIPGGKLKDVFSDWMKKTISTYIDVFIRIATMYLGVFMISLVNDNFSDINFGSLGLSQKLIAKALIIMGVVIFIRQAPKLISDMFHLDSGGMKLGLMDKLAMGGALTAGAVAGGAFGTLGRNLVSGARGVKNADGAWNKVKAGLFGAASVGAGTLSGAARGFNRGKGAKNLADMKKAAGGAVAATSAAKAKRDKYRAAHTSPSGAIDTLGNVMWGHLVDTGVGVAGYFGVNNVQDLIDDNKQIDDINSKKKAIRSAAEDLIVGESNKQGVDKSFGLAGTAKVGNRNIAFSTATLRSMRQQMEIAKSSGAANAGALQDDYDTYLKQFTDAVQNQALLGTHSFDRLLSSMNVRDAKSLEADLGDVRNAASDFRKSIRDNINATYIVDSGFTMDMVDDSNDLRLKDNAMDVLGDTLKIAKNRNNTNMNNLQQKKENSGK